MTWRIFLRPVRHMTTFSSIPQKRTKPLQLTITLYYLPIVLSITTKHNFIPFLYGHQIRKYSKIVYVVWDILSRNRPLDDWQRHHTTRPSDCTFWLGVYKEHRFTGDYLHFHSSGCHELEIDIHVHVFHRSLIHLSSLEIWSHFL